MKYKVGDKIKFKSEKQRYIIKACNERFLICTKPFNLKKTFLYTLVDLKQEIRGTEGKYCLFAYDKPEIAQQALGYMIETAKAIEEHRFIEIDWFSVRRLEVDPRYSVKLDIEG